MHTCTLSVLWNTTCALLRSTPERESSRVVAAAPHAPAPAPRAPRRGNRRLPFFLDDNATDTDTDTVQIESLHTCISMYLKRFRYIHSVIIVVSVLKQMSAAWPPSARRDSAPPQRLPTQPRLGPNNNNNGDVDTLGQATP